MKGLLQALDAMRGVRVAVVGDVMLDRYVYGSVARLSPEAPVPVFRPERREQMLGGAGNVAACLRALGAETVLQGLLGKDDAGEVVRRMAADLEIESRLIEGFASVTTVKERYVAGGQQLLRCDTEGPPPDGSFQASSGVDFPLRDVDAVILADYGKGVVSAALADQVIRTAKARDIPVVVDPAPDHFGWYHGATAMTPNAREFAAAYGAFDAAAMLAAMKRLDLAHLAVTRGESGIRLASRGRIGEFPTRARQVFDVAGAGDTVTAVVGACLGAGVPIETAVDLANLAASLVVEKRGTATVSGQEVRRALAGTKMETPGGAILMARHWRDAGFSIGFTNGVFDLLHPGHLHLLRHAKSRCDRLIVALNSDQSAARLKPGRPVQELAARMDVIAALDRVDAVTWFGDPGPLALIEAIKPDVLVKGGDYADKDVAGRDVVEASGGRFLIVPLLPGYSTSRTVGRLTGA